MPNEPIGLPPIGTLASPSELKKRALQNLELSSPPARTPLPFLSTEQQRQELHLVRTILQKTQENKLQWNRTSEGYETKTPDGTLEAYFTAQQGLWTPGLSWSAFTIISSGEVLLKFEKESNFLMTISGLSSSLIQPIDELFSYIGGFRLRLVKQAITALEEL
jgi:hypothetical protein